MTWRPAYGRMPSFRAPVSFFPAKFILLRQKYDFPAVTLVLPTIVLLLHIAALDQRQPQKTGVTRTATQRVPLVNSSRNRSADEPFSVNSREHEIVKVSRPCRFERGVPRRGQVRCFCPGLPFASLLKSNNCLLFTRLTSARRCALGVRSTNTALLNVASAYSFRREIYL